MKNLIFSLVCLLVPMSAWSATDATMTWQVTNATGQADLDSWQILQFDIGIGQTSFSIHGAVIFPSNVVALTGSCVFQSATVIFRKANFSNWGLEMSINTTGPELTMSFTTFSPTHVSTGSGSAVLTSFVSL